MYRTTAVPERTTGGNPFVCLNVSELMEGSPPLEKGERVRVEGVRGLRLVVQPGVKKMKTINACIGGQAPICI